MSAQNFEFGITIHSMKRNISANITKCCHYKGN